MAESAGELYVSITGDISALLTALQQGEDAAKQAGEAIAAALDTGTADKSFQALGDAAQTMGEQAKQAGTDLQTLATDTAEAGTEATSATGGWRELYQEIEQTATQSEVAGAKVHDLGDEARTAGEHAEEAESGLKAFAEQIVAIGEALVITEALLETGKEALDAFGEEERVTTSFKQLSGSIEETEQLMAKLKTTASQLGISEDDLMRSAQHAAAAFGTGEGLTGVLEAAANASGATGQAFSSVVSSLERVELTGQVSARQLVALGLSWKDLATTMGTSIEDAQEKLKKGGQDAEADLDVLLKAISTKFGDAAAEQAKGLVGQFQTFKNQIENILQDIGAALAPVIEDLLSFARTTIIPFIKELIEGFNSIPAPAKEIVIVLGLALAAIIPLTAAVGAFAIALAGLETLVPSVTGLLGTFGVTASTVAVEETAAAAATEALGVAATGAKGALTGLLGTLVEFSPLLLGVGAAIIATFGQLETLKEKYADLDTEIRNHKIVDSLQTGTTVQQLKDLGFSVDQIKEAVGGMNQQLEKIGPLFVDIGAKIQVVMGATEGLAASTQAFVDAQDKADRKVTEAAQAIDELSAAQDGSQRMADALNRAIVAYGEALKGAEPAVKSQKDNFDSLVASLQKAQNTFASAKTLLEQTAVAFQNGTVGIGALDQAYMKVEASAKAAGQTFSDVTVKAELMTKAAQDQFAALTTAVEVWQKLKDGSIPGSQAAIADALEAVDAAAKKVGISVTQVGQGLQFVTQGAANAKGPVADLANALNGLANVQQDGVIINGKWVATLQQGIDAAGQATGAFQVFKGSADQLNTSLDDLNTTMVYTDGRLETAAELIKQVNQAWDDAADAAKNAAQATVDATDEIGGQLTKVKNAGKGGAGGGNTSMLGLFEDVASAVGSPLASTQGSFTSNDLDNLAATIGLFKTGNNQYSTTDPSADVKARLAQASSQFQSASSTISDAGSTLSSGSTQLQTASEALTTAATSTTTSSTAIQQAASVLNNAATGLAMIAPSLGLFVPSSTGISMPTIPGVAPSLARVGDIITSTPADRGPVIQLTITGNTISSQAAADQLAKTMIDKLRNQAQLKLT